MKKNRDFPPIGKLKKIKDTLPPPDKLVVPQETVKVTLALTKSSINFFKKEAKKNHTQYQKMIRALIDKYADSF